MGDSEGLVDQEALEGSITNEEVSEVQEEKPNSEINEESNNESNEPQESGVAGEEENEEAQEIPIADNEDEEESQNPNQQLDVPGEEEKGDAQEKTIADNEAKEQPQNPNQLSGVPGIKSSTMRQQSHVKSQPSLSQSFQNSPSSTDRHTLQQVKSHMPLTNVVSVSEGRPMINPRTGKEIHSNLVQTSSVWEKIPLAKILCPSWTTAQGNEVIEWETMDTNEVVVHTEGCQPIVEEAENGDQAPAGTELKHSGQVAEETGSQHDQLPPQDEESGQKDHPTEQQLSQHGDQQPVEQQNTTEVNAEDNAVRVSQKSGKKIRDSTIQTSLIWERKPLAQILPPLGNKADRPDSPDSTQKSKNQKSFFNWPDPFEF